MTAPARTPIDIAEVVHMLSARADVLARELLPNGRLDGREWRCGSLDGEPGQSLAVHIGGTRPGVWCDFSTGESGDALDLVAAALFGNDKRAAFRWALGWLGIERLDPAALDRRRRQVAAQAAKLDKRDAEAAERKRRTALRFFLEAEAQIAGTAVDLYLKGRAIDLGLLGRQPRALRFHPSLTYKWRPAGGPKSADPDAGRSFPAMVAAIMGPDGQMISLHRTYLVQTGRGYSKAPVKEPKMTLGEFRGGLISLWRGASGKPLRDAPPDDTVVIAEGIENGLSVAVKRPDCRVLAAISLANLANVRLPPQLTNIVIAADNDPAADQVDALNRAAWRLEDEGRSVRIARAPADYKDMNDWLRGIRK